VLEGVRRHRRCIVLRGKPEETRLAAASITGALGAVLWVGADGVPPSRVRRFLGGSVDAVVIDLHGGIDADVLGQCHGLVRGGGALVLCCPPCGAVPSTPSLVLLPYREEDVGCRFWSRLERALDRAPVSEPREPLEPPPPIPGGTEEQRCVVERVADMFQASDPACAVLIADRGRGKSSALGLAARAAIRDANLRVAVTAWTRAAAAEVLRFADCDAGRPCFVEPIDLVREHGTFHAIVVDEAAQLPVPLLRELVWRHPRARIAFATTTHGYEGTGRGFVLRFLSWLDDQPRPVTRFMLQEPVRWDPGDPLERWVFELLALDAEASQIGVEGEAVPEPVVLDRDELARDESLLRSLFGLLVHAHYRTTPGDLHRLLDAPNLAVHAILDCGVVVAATLVAREGGLPLETCEAYATGRGRIRGHALADTLMTHAGRVEAGTLSYIRSVRIATHPSVRRRGLARKLVEHVHRTYEPDLFGTTFGATPELLAFRRAVGYGLVRVGAARGTRTGEPSAIMLRAVSARGEALVRELRHDLARDLPIQLALLDAEGDLGLDPRLASALWEGVGPAQALGPDEILRRVACYLKGPQTSQAAAYALERFVEAHHEKLDLLEAREKRLVEARVRARQAWRVAATRGGYPSVGAAMRALRPAIRKLFGGDGAG